MRSPVQTKRTASVLGAALIVAVPVLGLAACGNGTSAASSSAASPTSTDPTVAVVGMTVPQAEEWAKNHGYSVRVVEENGTPLPATMDYRTDRINVKVSDGVITGAKIG